MHRAKLLIFLVLNQFSVQSKWVLREAKNLSHCIKSLKSISSLRHIANSEEAKLFLKNTDTTNVSLTDLMLNILVILLTNI